MPVDPTQSVVTEEGTLPDTEFEDAFSSADDETPDTPEVEPEKKEVSADTADTKTDDVPEASSQEEDTEGLSALELAEKIAGERMAGKTKEEDDEPPESDTSKKEETIPEIDFTDVDRDPKAYAKKLVDTIEDNERKESLNNLMETYPEIFDGIVLIARDLVGRQKVKLADGVNIDFDGDFNQLREELMEFKEFQNEYKMEASERAFFDAVEKEVPGARSLSKSEEFGEWLDRPQQSVGIQMLAESPDPKDAILVLKAFNEYKTRLTAENVDNDARKKKQNRDLSLASNSRSSRSDKIFDPTLDDFEAGFNG